MVCYGRDRKYYSLPGMNIRKSNILEGCFSHNDKEGLLISSPELNVSFKNTHIQLSCVDLTLNVQ